jgi:glutaryl-CoA dehydrogenase (non-decarboxylating)
MKLPLTEEQIQACIEFREFVDAEIIPHATRYDQEGILPTHLIERLARAGYLGAILSPEVDGRGMDMISFGLLHAEVGRGCSSVRSLLTVHSMVSHALSRWGSAQQKMRWLKPLACGDLIAAFGLSEQNAGSDAQSIETTAVRSSDDYMLNGHKRWVSFGQLADLFLIFAKLEGSVAAFLVERDAPGLTITPIWRMLGTRASMLAELTLRECRVPQSHLLGGGRLGLAGVATSALDIGRYSVAWGCVGIAQACLEDSIIYTRGRRQFGAYLKDYQLIQQMIAEMTTNTQAARLLCFNAGYQKQQGDPDTLLSTLLAKYFAAKIALQAASDAVQIHGAHGCSEASSVQRYFRDAKVMEIIEGSTQIQQIMIADDIYRRHSTLSRE